MSTKARRCTIALQTEAQLPSLRSFVDLFFGPHPHYRFHLSQQDRTFRRILYLPDVFLYLFFSSRLSSRYRRSFSPLPPFSVFASSLQPSKGVPSLFDFVCFPFFRQGPSVGAAPVPSMLFTSSWYHSPLRDHCHGEPFRRAGPVGRSSWEGPFGRRVEGSAKRGFCRCFVARGGKGNHPFPIMTRTSSVGPSSMNGRELTGARCPPIGVSHVGGHRRRHRRLRL